MFGGVVGVVAGACKQAPSGRAICPGWQHAPVDVSCSPGGQLCAGTRQAPPGCGFCPDGQHTLVLVNWPAGHAMQLQSGPSIWPFWQGSAFGGQIGTQPLAPGFLPDGHTVDTWMQVPLLNT